MLVEEIKVISCSLLLNIDKQKNVGDTEIHSCTIYKYIRMVKYCIAASHLLYVIVDRIILLIASRGRLCVKQ